MSTQPDQPIEAEPDDWASLHLPGLHPAVRRWLTGNYTAATPVQERAWPQIRQGGDVLVAAPTGSGKTFCAFINAIDDLVWMSERAPLPDATFVLYISPLKALSRDIELNLRRPLQGIFSLLTQDGGTRSAITSAVRTGDTSAKERSALVRRPAHILVTTPESLYILLTSESGRHALSTVKTVIIDEVHALVGDKRGAHLSLSLERLDDVLGQSGRPRAQRIGLSATQNPIERVAQFLTGIDGDTRAPRPCHIIDVGHRRAMDVKLWVPEAPLSAVMSAESWTEIYDELARQVTTHRTTLVFVNTRRLVERVARFLSERLGSDAVASHHGSLAQDRRLLAEQKLRSGEIKVLVASASMELGIDVGDVDLVCQISSPRSISTFLQRVGRSGHWVGGLPKGRLFPTSRDDLVEAVALMDAMGRGELDVTSIPDGPLDILAQQIVASAVPHEWAIDDLYALVRRATPYAMLTLEQFMDVTSMLAEGFATARGRRGALVHLDSVGRRIKARRGARLTALTNGGAIVDNFDYDVLLAPQDLKIGSVHEDFAVESSPGDVFQLGNASYEVVKVESGRVLVRDAQGALPSLPFWLGEAPGRSDELSLAVSRLRERVASIFGGSPGPLISELSQQMQLGENASQQLVEYLATAHVALGHMPTQHCIVAERFFDAAGNMHVVIHSSYGTRLNRGFGLALRKRFCRTFNVELQAAITDDAIVLSLGPTHSFPLEDIFRLLHKNTVQEVLTQALLDAPLFTTRFRWNASRALAIVRFRSGKRVAPHFQRMNADDLLAICFPDQVACAENIGGEREIPDHPLVKQTIHDCLHEAMDLPGLIALLSGIASGCVSTVARDVTEPSPLAHEVLNARPYAFLDDAPLEERRTQAIQMRRSVSFEQATDLSALDPRAIAQVLQETAPTPRDADELHDALLVFGYLAATPTWLMFFDELHRAGRAHYICLGESKLWIAHERAAWFYAALPQSRSQLPSACAALVPDADAGLTQIVQSHLELSGPTTLSEISRELDLAPGQVQVALTRVETSGFALRGRFRPQSNEDEYCERRILARIHRLTLNQLRREIEPVTPAQFVDFLTYYQGLQPDTKKRGASGLHAILQQLSGFWAAALAWEQKLLAARVSDFHSGLLEELTRAGRVSWRAASGEAAQRFRFSSSTSVMFTTRESRVLYGGQFPKPDVESRLGADAKTVLALLTGQGALFLDDIKLEARLLPSQLEDALSELLASGLVTCDSFAAARNSWTKHRRTPRRPRGRNTSLRSLGDPGRYFRVAASPRIEAEDDPLAVSYAFSLLDRWGVVCKRLLDREQLLLPWATLRRVLSRLEARGEIRGGRFIEHISGEQFASKDAIVQLRQRRRAGPSSTPIVVSSYDPLNLLGFLDNEPRIAKANSTELLIVAGQFIASTATGRPARLSSVPQEGALSDETIAQALAPRRHPAFERRPLAPQGAQ